MQMMMCADCTDNDDDFVVVVIMMFTQQTHEWFENRNGTLDTQYDQRVDNNTMLPMIKTTKRERKNLLIL